MKEIVVLSGKGGTGKTSIVGSFSVLAESKVLCDCDVDAADLHLIIEPQKTEVYDFVSGQTALIDSGKCTECGLCQDLCRFNAICACTIDPASCEGCGFCSRACPEEAIHMRENLAGHWFVSETDYGPMVHARLGIAEENSGKLVTTVRTEAKRIAEEQGAQVIITDGPPGIGCPVISSLSGAHLALIVTEPTLSGMHDLERVMGVCRHFGVPVMVCVNKYDINENNTKLIESMCDDLGVAVVGKIPFDDVVTEALIAGMPIVNYSDGGQIAEVIKSIWESIAGILNNTPGNGE